MSVNLEYFRSWFVRLLESLYPQTDAGFAITMIAFPRLERYLRQKVQLTPKDSLSSAFYDELYGLFPELQSAVKVSEFWQIYRNGILH